MVRQKLCVIALLTGFFRKIPDIFPLLSYEQGPLAECGAGWVGGG